ncbi:vWA-MoxR associated conflict system protein [Streptomyces blattellae]|uniref:vWA-MoxR associated conflict system protein n=1 Tax=Streptomyces blattellae TaxID=2569855 RepID=UPI001E46944F|nr:hypothetical protein [Streptomyces blattellae]
MTGPTARHVLVIAAQCGSMVRLTRLGRAARDLHAVLTDPVLGGCARRIGAHRSLLIGDDLSPEDVRTAMGEAVARARADSAVLIVALLGHGFTPPQQTDLYYMVGGSTTESTGSAVHVGQLLSDAADTAGVDGVIALVDTCHAGGAVPDARRLAGGVRSGRARLAVLTAALAGQDARDLKLTFALTEVLRQGVAGAGSALYVDRTLTGTLRERVGGQAVGRAEYDNDPYALQGLWLARNARHPAAGSGECVGPLGRRVLREAVEMWRRTARIPERLTLTVLEELHDFARTGRPGDETEPLWRERVAEVTTALLECVRVADLVDDTLDDALTSDLLRTAGRLAGFPPVPEDGALLRDLLEYAALRAQPADSGRPGQGLARFLAALADLAGLGTEHSPLRAWARQHRLTTAFNDALKDFTADREQQRLRLVISLAGAWTGWPEEVEAYLVRGGADRPAQWSTRCVPPDPVGVGLAIGKALSWARGQLPAPDLLVHVDVAAPAHLVARWQPEEAMIGQHFLGAHHSVMVRWSGRLDPAAGNAETNDAARKSLQAMAACGRVPVEWVDAGILHDRPGLEFALRAGQYATAVGVDHHPEDLPDLLELLLPYAPIVLWPRQDARPADDRLRRVVRQQWHTLPGGFVDAYRARWKAHRDCLLCLGDIRAVWHDEYWLEFCRPFERRVISALEEES